MEGSTAKLSGVIDGHPRPPPHTPLNNQQDSSTKHIKNVDRIDTDDPTNRQCKMFVTLEQFLASRANYCAYPQSFYRNQCFHTYRTISIFHVCYVWKYHY
jgi:hypothetical protein